MTPPHTRLITSATAPLPWITVGSPGYLTVISSLEDWRGGWWESTSQTALRRETGWLGGELRRCGRRLGASRRPLWRGVLMLHHGGGRIEGDQTNAAPTCRSLFVPVFAKRLREASFFVDLL